MLITLSTRFAPRFVQLVVGLLLLVTASSAAAASDAAADRAALLDGVTSIEAVGSPGPIVVFGPTAFAVLTDARGEALVGAAHHGEGRVVAFGHGGYCGRGKEGSDRQRLLDNALGWAAGGRPDAKVATLRSGLELDGVDVLLWPGGALPERDQQRARSFVLAGGGLVVGQCPWGWQQLNPEQRLRDDAPVNRVTAPMGLAFGPTTLSGPFVVAESRPELAHASEALASLLGSPGSGDDGSRAPEAVDRAARAQRLRCLERALTALPTGDRFLLPRIEEALADRPQDVYPTEARPLGADQGLGRLGVAFWTRRWEDLPANEIEPAPGADDFPGAVPRGAERVVEIVGADASRGGWLSTGLYAPPGEAVRVETNTGSARGWTLRIGAHTDSIAHKDAWRRWPKVSRSFVLAGNQAVVASPFGGLIYLEAPSRGAEAIELRIAGAVRAPLFDARAPLGEAAWREERALPGPWAEIAGELLVVTVPSASVRELDDPARVAAFWDAVVRTHYQLAQRPLPTRPERFVADVQISAGYMHSGYPIMTQLDVARPTAAGGLAAVLDVDVLETKGSWGHFHELGHNLQRSWWTFSGTGEVTCNLFSLHAMDKVVGLEPWTVDWLENQKARGLPHLAAGAPFEDWKRKAGLALLCYAQVQREFGWEPFYAAFAGYEAAERSKLPNGDDEKRDQWLVRLSRATDRDLGPLFERWGIPVGEAARSEVAPLEDWLPDFAELEGD